MLPRNLNLRLRTFLSFWYWPITVLVHVMLFHCIYHRTLWIHRTAAVKKFISKKNESNFWLWELVQLQLRILQDYGIYFLLKKMTFSVFKVQWLHFTNEVGYIFETRCISYTAVTKCTAAMVRYCYCNWPHKFISSYHISADWLLTI